MKAVLTTWTCEACPDRPVFRSWLAAERHARAAHQGARISVAVPARRRPDVEPDAEPNPYDLIEAYAGEGPTQLHRTVLAVTLAVVEPSLRNTWGRFDAPDVVRHYAYLASLGYTPSTWEQERLDEAAEAERAAHAPDDEEDE